MTRYTAIAASIVLAVPLWTGFAAAQSKRERWERIALAAAKQSGRTTIPEIGVTLTFPEVVTAAAAMQRGYVG